MVGPTILGLVVFSKQHFFEMQGEGNDNEEGIEQVFPIGKDGYKVDCQKQLTSVHQNYVSTISML